MNILVHYPANNGLNLAHSCLRPDFHHFNLFVIFQEKKTRMLKLKLLILKEGGREISESDQGTMVYLVICYMFYMAIGKGLLKLNVTQTT